MDNQASGRMPDYLHFRGFLQNKPLFGDNTNGFDIHWACSDASPIRFYIRCGRGYFLERIGHQIFATNEAEDGNVVVVIDYSERAKNLI